MQQLLLLLFLLLVTEIQETFKGDQQFTNFRTSASPGRLPQPLVPDSVPWVGPKGLHL